MTTLSPGTQVRTPTDRHATVFEVVGRFARVKMPSGKLVPYRLDQLRVVPAVRRWAVFDPTNDSYRYELGRQFEPGPAGIVLFVLCNPSTANESNDDPTIRRCMSFAQRWEFGTVLIGNLFAYRTPYPADMFAALKRGTDIVGPRNDEYLAAMAERATRIVCAWGSFQLAWDRSKVVYQSLMQHRPKMVMLRRAITGAPYHPLYVPQKIQPIPFEPYW